MTVSEAMNKTNLWMGNLMPTDTYLRTHKGPATQRVLGDRGKDPQIYTVLQLNL